MRWCILLCCFAATLTQPPATAQEPGDAPAPDAAMAAYRAVDAWVRAWSVGDPPPGEPPVPPCQAASVTLRLAGETIGRGVEVAADEASRSSIIAQAARAALKDAEPRLGAPRDAMYEATVKDIAKRITISLQLAGDLVPISPKDAAEAMTMVAPGVEGVAARLGTRMEVTFPERMLTTGTEPGPALGTLVGKLAEDAALAVEPLSKLAKDNGAVFYRFRVAHLAQPKAGDTPVFLKRCGKPVPRAGLDAADLRRWADELALHLIGAAKVVEEVNVAEAPGAHDPVRGIRGADSPLTTGSILTASLASYASTPGTQRLLADRALTIAEAYYSGLCSKFDGVPRQDEPVAAALAQWATHVFRRAGGKSGNSMFWTVEGISANETWGSMVETGRDNEGAPQYKIKPYQWSQEFWKSPSAGAIAAGMAVSHETLNEELPGAATLAREHATKVFLGSTASQLPSQMPWLGWAQQALHPGGELPAAIALREMRSLLWQHQLQPDSLPPDQQDLAGGILFTASQQPMPTWHMARPLAFIATMLGDPRLTEDHEVPEEISRLLLSLRFLRQLTAGEAECFMYKNPDRAKGGVRSSLWDQRMPPEATAMTLLTVCETLRSLDEIRKRQDEKK